MKRLLILPLLLWACGPKKPPVIEPTPPPEPPPVVQTVTVGLLRNVGPDLTIDGKPAQIVFRANCCMDEGEPPMPPQGWPLWTPEAIDKAYEESGGKLNMIEIRPGPFLSRAEPNYKRLGTGPYVEVDGKADLFKFSPSFWTLVDDLVIRAGKHGIVVMIPVFDSWVCKTPDYPGRPANNVQGFDAFTTCTSAVDASQTAWMENLVKTVGRHHNVIWLDGNEPGGTGRYRAGWTFEVQAKIRELERQNSYPVHMFGTGGNDEAWCGVDYVVFHSKVPLTEPVCNRPTMSLEMNPDPPFSAGIMYSYFKRSQAARTTWGLWRHGMSDAEWAALWKLVRDEAPADVGLCPLNPLPDLDKLSFWIDNKSRPGYPDSTPFIRGSHEHCVNVGMGTWADTGKARFDCPLANEGDPRRVPCEVWALKGPHPLFRSDGEVTCADEACFRVRATGSWLEVCDNEGNHCKRADLQ